MRSTQLGWLLLWAVLAPAGASLLAGCQASNARAWKPDQSILATAEFQGEQVTVRNVRNNRYLTTDDFVTDYEDRVYDLRRLESVDFIMVPFKELPSLAHTMLSFGFEGGEHVAVSVEIRKEVGESYAPLAGVLGEYELMYVIGDERDLVALRTAHRKDDVYLYRAKATPEQARALFVDVLERANQLAREPELYNTLTNNCTTNIVRHVNRLAPDSIPDDLRVLLPGYSDRLAYDLGLLDTPLPFEEARRQALITPLANRYLHDPDFSRKIR